MYYRFECLLKNEYRNTDCEKWDGIFDYMLGDTLSLWSGLHGPKWYAKNPGRPSKAWFTEAGYKKWHKTMERCIATLLQQYALDDFSVRLVVSPSLGEVGMRGKVQCIEVLGSWDEYFVEPSPALISKVWRSEKAKAVRGEVPAFAA